MSAVGLLLLRLALAAVFIAHGSHTVFGLFGGPGIGPGGLTNTAAEYVALGLEPGFLLAVLAGVIQLLGGVLLAVGFLTRWAAGSLFGYLLLDASWQHSPWGFFLNWTGEPGLGHGVEYVVVLMGATACLILTGSGTWSIDGLRESTKDRRALGRDRIRRRF